MFVYVLNQVERLWSELPYRIVYKTIKNLKTKIAQTGLLYSYL